jgi:hypothetical protein
MLIIIQQHSCITHAFGTAASPLAPRPSLVAIIQRAALRICDSAITVCHRRKGTRIKRGAYLSSQLAVCHVSRRRTAAAAVRIQPEADRGARVRSQVRALRLNRVDSERLLITIALSFAHYRVKTKRETLKTLKKKYDKTEDDLKALQVRIIAVRPPSVRRRVRSPPPALLTASFMQSVGQMIGEVLKQLDDEHFIVKSSSGPRHVVGVRKKVRIERGCWAR